MKLITAIVKPFKLDDVKAAAKAVGAAGITLPHPLVSRQHCEIYEEQGRLVVNDMGSLNGTFVGDQRINEPTFLLPGELLTVGTVTFRAAYSLGNGAAQIDDAELLVGGVAEEGEDVAQILRAEGFGCQRT